MPGEKDQNRLLSPDNIIQNQLDKERAAANSKSKNFRQKSLHQDLENLPDRPEASGPVLVRQKVIHNFTKEIRVAQELKVVKPKTIPAVTTRRVQAPKLPPVPVILKPIPIPVPLKVNLPSDDESKQKPDVVTPPQVLDNTSQGSKYVNLDNTSTLSKIHQKPEHTKTDYQVYRLGDIYNGRRVLMKNLGIDIGTKTVVVAYQGEDNKVGYISEINGYWPFERSTPFIENMLDDPSKVRSDGTKRPAKWIKLDDRAIVLGKDAEEFAYAKNDTMLRPMAEGGISADEEAMTVLGSIVQGLMEMAENEIGKFDGEVKVCYCTTAPALNKDSNIEYHERVINLVIAGYETKAKLAYNSIKESHAIVIDMSDDGTGIGISWGAGTVTVSYVKYGLEVYSFCWIGAGDWIDEQVASRHGYDPEHMKTRRKKAKETPTTVSKKKMTIDLTPGVDYNHDRLALDIVLHYDVLINKVIEGIVAGFEDNEAEARIEDAINVYMAGGTSSPKGFTERVTTKFDDAQPPFSIGLITNSDKPLYCVATGCLKAAEMF